MAGAARAIASSIRERRAKSSSFAFFRRSPALYVFLLRFDPVFCARRYFL
jgi:hypothetical protein